MLRDKAAIMSRVFTGPNGEAALELLREQFDMDNLVGQSVEDTYMNIGRRDVVKYIEQLLRVAGND